MNAPEPVGSGHPSAIRLLERIEAYGFDAPDDPLGFETRLADDNGWTLGHARLVVAEYRRFLVLTRLAKEPVSPSQDVDQAWHLHLTRTAHYAAFCEAVFGRFLHHEPGRSDGGDAQRHRQMYDYTFKVYQRGFGVPPPVAIWPRPGVALPPEPAAAPRWTVPERLRPDGRLGVALVAAALVASRVPGMTTLLSSLMVLSPGVFVTSSIVVTIVVDVLRNGSGAARAAHWRRVLDPYEVAWFAGGASRMAMTGIVALAERGVLRVPGDVQDGALVVERGSAALARHPVEAACLRAATTAGLRFSDACAAVAPVADAFERRLVSVGLIAPHGTMPRRHAQLLLAHAAWLVACFARCRQALLDSGRPGEMVLFLAMAIANALALMYFARRPSRILARAELPPGLLRGGANATPPQGEALVLAVAQSGLLVLAGDPRFAGMDEPSGALGEPALRAARQKSEDDGRSGFDGDSGFGAMFGGLFRPSCGSTRGASCGSGGAGGSHYFTPDLVGAGMGGDHGGGSHGGGDHGGGGHAGHGGDHGGGGSSGSSDGGSSCSGGGSSCSGGSSCGSSCSGGSSCSSGSSCGGGGSSD